jgi:hypothetical protein
MKRFFLIPVLLAATGLQPAGAAHPPLGNPQAPSAAANRPASTLVGSVVEILGASRYTYVRLDTGSSQVWVAANRTTLRIGDRVEATGLLPMDKFHSRELDRDFERIYFASSIGPPGTAASLSTLPPGHPEIPGIRPPADPAGIQLPPGHPDVAEITTPAPSVVTPLAPVAGGKTVAQVYAGKAELAGRTVAVRGKVTKVNNGILGRNWLHLVDGTGTVGSNDLTVTSKDQTARVGDTIVARGVVGLDRDFGGGYFYPVLLENAAVLPE